MNKPSFLKETLKNKLFISQAEANELRSTLSLGADEFLFALLEVIKERAVMPLSHFLVGAIAIGKSGNFYFGASHDFLHTSTMQCVHAEQSAVCNAFLHEETEIKMIVVNAAPCGFCRQFLYEMADSENLEILFPKNNKMFLHDLLPYAFGPKDLGREGGMLTMSQCAIKLMEKTDDVLINTALKAASRSYSSYWQSYAGVSLQTKDQKIFYGSFLENVAQNPGLSPMQAALIHLNLSGYHYTDIESVALVEMDNAKISHYGAAVDLLKAIGVSIDMRVSLALFAL